MHLYLVVRWLSRDQYVPDIHRNSRVVPSDSSRVDKLQLLLLILLNLLLLLLLLLTTVICYCYYYYYNNYYYHHHYY